MFVKLLKSITWPVYNEDNVPVLFNRFVLYVMFFSFVELRPKSVMLLTVSRSCALLVAAKLQAPVTADATYFRFSSFNVEEHVLQSLALFLAAQVAQVE